CNVAASGKFRRRCGVAASGAAGPRSSRCCRWTALASGPRRRSAGEEEAREGPRAERIRPILTERHRLGGLERPAVDAGLDPEAIEQRRESDRGGTQFEPRHAGRSLQLTEQGLE